MNFVDYLPQIVIDEKPRQHGKLYPYGAGSLLAPFIDACINIIERNDMLKNIKSPHFTFGGTGITNFGMGGDLDGASLASIYIEAIERHGDSNYVVSAHPMNGSERCGYSLHYIGPTFPRDCSAFWSVYDQVRKEREPEVGQMLIGDW